MKKTLWSRLFVCFLLSGVSFIVLLNTFGMSLLEKKLKDDKMILLSHEAKLIEDEYMTNFFDNTVSPDYLKSQLQSISTFLGITVWVANEEGIVSVDSTNNGIAEQRKLSDLLPNFSDENYTEINSLPGIFSEPMMSYMHSVSYKFSLRGYIILHYPLRGITDEASYYFDIINICFLLFLPLLSFLFLYIYCITAIPLKKLMKAAKEYSSGNYNYSFVLKSLSEYKDLGAAISYMSGELRQLDDYQKKFVANISHDFRSPLTSIKGFAEAIKDGTIPYEMQDKYLGIILFETERLTKLTSSLLELNRFESKGSSFLDITSFDINNIIKKTAESFEGSCREKKITLNLVFSSKENFVEADMGKIQQVLYNLIDNAIKFSHSNSKIKVSTEDKGDKVFVSVRDYGIGIPRDSIKKIWERFYKTDASRGKDKRGTGLGLSITKEIIQAHGENINVISTEGVGTEFVFSLTRTTE